MFLLEYVPVLRDELHGDLRILTIGSESTFLTGVQALDEVSVRMQVAEIAAIRIGFVFDHVRRRRGVAELAGRGWQQVLCVHGDDCEPVAVPEPLLLALRSPAVNSPTVNRAGYVRSGNAQPHSSRSITVTLRNKEFA